MYKFLFKFFVITITILTANLLTTALSDYLVSYRNHIRPVTFTFIGMGITVLVFYPLFTRMEEWVKKISTKFIRTGKSVGGKYIGLFSAFLIAILVLFYFYARMWYNLDFVKVLITGEIGSYV